MTDPSKFSSAEVIERLYEIILKPEKMNDFIAGWEAYIDHKASDFQGGGNAANFSEHSIADDRFEVHFARVYAILTRLDRTYDTAPGKEYDTDVAPLMEFDSSGALIHMSQLSQHAPFKKVKTAEDIGGFLREDASNAWKTFLARTLQAPQVESFHIFALKKGGNLVALNIRDKTDGPVKIVLRELNVAWSTKLKDVLLKQFQLSSSEIFLVEQLTKLGTLDAVAKAGNKSSNTLRTQLKSVFKKMNLNSQAAVSQAVAVLSSLSVLVENSTPEPQEGISRGDRIDIDADGTIVPVHLFGPKDGHPIMFIHGMMDGVALPNRVVDELRRYNLRFISIVRPNFGEAKANPDIKNAPEIVARQLKEIVKKFDLRDVYLLGHMSGGLYAMAASPCLNDRLKGIINISCGVPILSAKQFSNLSKRQKAFAFTTRYAPALLPTLMRAGMAQIDSNQIETLLDDMYPKVSPDRELFERDPIVKAVVLDGYRFAVAQGYKGFQSDALQVTRDWSEYVTRNDKPVLLIHGKEDPAAAYDYVPDFARREGFRLETYPTDGQLILYGKPDQVLGDIRAFIDQTL